MKGILKPANCNMCIDSSEMFNEIPDCSKCPFEQEVEIINFTESFWGAHAVIATKSGEVKSVPTSLIKLNTTR